jgi:hypothetical protein
MGATTCIGMSRDEVIDELTKDTQYQKTLAKRLIGSNLWTVQEYERIDGSWTRTIVLFKLYSDQGSTGYKAESASMRPTEFGCPLSFYEIAGPPEDQTAKTWRERNAAHLAEKSKGRDNVRNLITGDAFTFNGKAYQLLEHSKSSIIAVRIDNGERYRIGPRHFAKILVGEESTS